MPSTNYINIVARINKYCRNYAVTFFHDMQGNAILLLLAGWIEAISGGAPTSILATTLELTSADFINATDCPLVALDGLEIVIFYNDASRYIRKADGEWTDLAGGGFRILLPGFDSTAATYHFYVNLKG